MPRLPNIYTVVFRAGTNTPSDEYDTYREYRVANTNMYSRIHFFSEAKLGNGLSVLVYACTMYSAQKFHLANLVYYRYCLFASVTIHRLQCAQHRYTINRNANNNNNGAIYRIV